MIVLSLRVFHKITIFDFMRKLMNVKLNVKDQSNCKKSVIPGEKMPDGGRQSRHLFVKHPVSAG